MIDQGAQSSTIKSYFSAIKFMLKADNYEWDDNKILLTSITRSCRLQNDLVKTRCPIRHSLFEMTLFELERIYASQPYLETLYKALFSLAYYGLMRVGELTEAKACHTLKACDVHMGINKNKILLILYSLKTHGQESEPQQIKISEVKQSVTRKNFFCPFSIVRSFINLRGGYNSQQEQFFVFNDQSNVNSNHFRKTLKLTLRRLNLDDTLYNTHSLRIGRTTDLFKAGYSIEQIKHIGRWRSNAVYKYIRSS